MWMPWQCVRIDPSNERIGGEEIVEQFVADQRLEMNHLVRRKKILLLQRQLRIGQDQVRADDASPAKELRQQQHGDGNGPDMLAARHDEEIEVPAALEIQMRDAARKRDHTRKGHGADQPQHRPIALQKRAAAGFSMAALRNQVVATGREEESVAIADDTLHTIAAVERSEDLRRRLVGFDERLMQLIEPE